MDIRTVCLGLLSLREATGYELKKRMEIEVRGCGVEPSFGSIYPALNKLAQDGLISVEAAPGRGSASRKIYSITKAGQEAFITSLSKLPKARRPSTDFLLYLTFAHLMSRDKVAALIDSEMKLIREEVRKMETGLGATTIPAKNLISGVWSTLMNAMLAFLTDHRAEFERLARPGQNAAPTAD